MKNLIKIVLSLLMILGSFNSCISEKDELNNNANNFDYSFYNSNKENSLKLEVINIFKKSSKPNTEILNYINTQLGSTPTLTEFAFEYFNYSGSEIRNHAIKDGIFNKTDVKLLDEFIYDIQANNFEIGISKFETTVLSLNLPKHEFNKYNTFANIIKFIEYQNHYFSNTNIPIDSQKNSYSARMSWDCAIAISEYTLLTVAVGVACVPEPAAPLACPLAVGFAVTGYANMINECTK
jgi:hypothetical protein